MSENTKIGKSETRDELGSETLVTASHRGDERNDNFNLKHSFGQDEANEPSCRRGGLLTRPIARRGLSVAKANMLFVCLNDKLVGGFCSRWDDEVRETLFGCRGAGNRRVEGGRRKIAWTVGPGKGRPELRIRNWQE
ncbi:hypothetical protein L1987_01928 [Smallanthus sonchifolius]|uniref:Uncharacterized protein n=1 Tax=Smallanthus sonchifolius TaxID=185202 RepID=A0ACB9K6E5_9ASTR|nr:hypothetical protein L1987_01928 [Smallanthus sonchifolius]